MLKKKFGGVKILLIVELLIALWLLLGGIRRDELVEGFSGEDISGLTAWEGEYGKYCGDRIDLEPGVYQVRIWAGLAEGQQISVVMKCDQAYFRTLRNNGVNLYAGREYEEFEVFVSDKVSGAYVQCDFYGADSGALVRLEMYRTGAGNRRWFFAALAFFAALDFFVFFRRRILEGKVGPKRQAAFWILLAAVLVAYFPYLTDYFSVGSESFFQWGRIAYLADALEEGALLPVRLEGGWLNGHGYASSLFCSDLFLYVPALLYLIGFSIMDAYKLFVLLVLAATAIIAYHSFYKCVKEEYAALFGSVAYLLAPRHIYDIYNRGAVDAYLAAAFLPLICCGMYLLLAEDAESAGYRKYKWYVVLGLSAVMHSHWIMLELLAVLLAAACILFWRRALRRSTLGQLLQTVGMVLALNAWFWVPRLYMGRADAYHGRGLPAGGQDTGASLAGLLQILPEKGYAQTGAWHHEPAELGAGFLMLFALYGLWRLRRAGGGRRGSRVCGTLALSGILLTFMATRYFPWNALQKLLDVELIAASASSPLLWILPASSLAAMLGAFVWAEAMENGGTLFRSAMGIIALVTVLAGIYHVDSIAFDSVPVWLYNIESVGSLSVAEGEYLLRGTDVSEMVCHGPVAEEGLAWSEYEKRGTSVAMYLENASDKVLSIEIPLTGYRGYGVRASDTAAGVPSVSGQRGAHGDLRLEVPAGYRGRVRILYEGHWIFRVAEMVSAACLAAVCAGKCYSLWVKRRIRVGDGDGNAGKP